MEKIRMGRKYKYRTGHPVRILCTDSEHISFPVIAMDLRNGYVSYHKEDGSSTTSSNLDLLPDITKKKFWMNIYKGAPPSIVAVGEPARSTASRIASTGCCLFDTKALAHLGVNSPNQYLATIEIEIEVPDEF